MSTPAQSQRVGTLELFFNLVFVFTVTRLVLVLEHEPNATGVARSALMLAVIFWMYGGYAWLSYDTFSWLLSRDEDVRHGWCLPCVVDVATTIGRGA